MAQAERLRSLRDLACEIAPTMQCNCDLDNWQPEPATGHSCVCRIHKAALGRWVDLRARALAEGGGE